MQFFGAIWNLYLGLLTLLGNAILVLLGIGLCGYATYGQMQPLHNTTNNVLLFVVGLLLISFSMVRRMVWSFCGLAAIWAGILWCGMQIFTKPHDRIEFSLELLAIVGIPPFFMTLYLESVRKNTSDLEISLTKGRDGDI